MHATVFDFDGVLAQSMHQHAAAFRTALAPLGVAVTDGRVFALEGARSAEVMQSLCRDSGVPCDGPRARDLAARKQAAFESMGVPPLYAGVHRVVDSACRLGPVAVVTGTKRGNVERVLGRLADRFDAILAEDSYRRAKPHPEPYEKALEALGVDARWALAIENAPRGIRSARAAGYGQVWAVQTTLGNQALQGAHRVLPDHAALADALDQLTVA